MKERAEWETVVEHVRGLSASRGATVEYPPLPATKPYFRALYAGEEGRIWVHRYTEAEKRDPPPATWSGLQLLSWMEPPTFDVFEPDDGTFLRTVVLPHDTRLLALRGQQVWVAHTDEVGTERIVRYHVEPNPGGDERP